MRIGLTVLAVVAGTAGLSLADEPARIAPRVVVTSPDGKKAYDLSKLTANGPVLVRLTCACSGCDQELPYFQKLQAAYDAKGLRTLAVFQEQPQIASEYVQKKGIKFLWVANPKGELWKTFDTKTMPTNILIDRGGRVVKVVAGCTKDGKNAQALSAEVAKLLKTEIAPIAESKLAEKK
jgi:peroxiredoxin